MEVDVNRNIIELVLRSHQDELGSDIVNKARSWLEGRSRPTCNDVKILSDVTGIPLGYFLMPELSSSEYRLIVPRTLGGESSSQMSQNYFAVSEEMLTICDWMTDYRSSINFVSQPFVETVDANAGLEGIAKKIREDLGLSPNWSSEFNSPLAAFDFFRGRLDSKFGIVVMMKGYVDGDTSRFLRVDNDHRAFAIVDKVAPLIFINSNDNENARLFSLVYEAVNIWLGAGDLRDWTGSSNDDFKVHLANLGQTCNAVAGELLLPERFFLEEWRACPDNEYDKFNRISQKFNCSRTVVARKARDNDLITQAVYENVSNGIRGVNLENNRAEAEANPDDYEAVYYNLSPCFMRALCEAIQRGYIAYSDAYHMTGTDYISFPKVLAIFSKHVDDSDIFNKV